MEAALRALRVTVDRLDDAALRQKLEALAVEPLFKEFTWLWGPLVARRNSVIFRPFILSNFSAFALDDNAAPFDPWKGETGDELRAWLREADRADDVELTRRLLGWQLDHAPWKDREKLWRAEVLRRLSSAKSAAARFSELGKVDVDARLDGETALALYDLDPKSAHGFILRHLPWFGWGGEKRAQWKPLLDRSRDADPEFHFDLYRRVVDEKQWRSDVLALCSAVSLADALDAELERRHPIGHIPNAGAVFVELAQRRKRDVMPYLLRHVDSVYPRPGFFGQTAGKELGALLALSEGEGWLDLWAALLRTSVPPALFDETVHGLVKAPFEAEPAIRTKLSLIAGHGREANLPGVSFVQGHPLVEATALAMYARFPDLLRGAFRLHVSPGYRHAYPRLVAAAIEAGDEELVDFFASRAALQLLGKWTEKDWPDTVRALTAHFEALPDRDFVQRASNALSKMPAFAIWNYDELLKSNALARLLFERSTALYLDDATIIRDLLESPQIHVQALAFRILGRDDPRARTAGAANADLLQATLLRPLHRRTRLLAFAAVARAAEHDADTARYLLGRMREALALPDKRYPKEKLIGLMGGVLHRWPALRGPSERPVVYGGEAT